MQRQNSNLVRPSESVSAVAAVARRERCTIDLTKRVHTQVRGRASASEQLACAMIQSD